LKHNGGQREYGCYYEFTHDIYLLS
jgi:hypothetical protein